MDTLDAQCLLTSVIVAGGDDRVVPVWWHHDADGTLSFRFSDGGRRTLSYPPEQVADLARRWRDEASGPPPEIIARHVGATRDVQRLLRRDEVAPCDAIVHDLPGQEVAVFWRERKLCVIVEVDRPPADLDLSRLPRVA